MCLFYFNANGHIKYINIITKICGPLCKIHFETSMFNLVLIVFFVFFTENSESSDGVDYPVDIWLVLSSYIRPEDVCRFALICRNAWTVTCTAAFWTRLYRRWGGFVITCVLALIKILTQSSRVFVISTVEGTVYVYDLLLTGFMHLSGAMWFTYSSSSCGIQGKCTVFMLPPLRFVYIASIGGNY